MRVLKFGGSSVASSENIQKVIKLVSAYDDEKLIIVVSALGGVTDQLITTSKLAEKGQEEYLQELKSIEEQHIVLTRALVDVRQQSGVLAKVKYELNSLDDILHGVFLIRELTPKTLDYILSFGEKLSAYIIACAFQNQQMAAEYVNASDLIITDHNFGKAQVQFELTYAKIKEYFSAEKGLWVLPGFIGSTPKGELSTLGRGGSDYTAAIVAAALDADAMEKWTDVEGLMTADPRSVSKSFVIENITYEEAMELSYFGAKVVYPPSLQPVYKSNIPFRIRSLANPEAKGTLISRAVMNGQKPIKGISSIRNIALLNLSGSGMVGVPGISKRLFSKLAEEKINIIMISQASSEHSISLAVEEQHAMRAKIAIEQEFTAELLLQQIEKVEIKLDLAIIAVVGKNMNNVPGISGTLFSSLGREGVNVFTIAQGASEMNISFIVRQQDEKKALNIIHDAFFLSDTKALNLFLIGTGQIGKTLLSQINEQLSILRSQRSIEVKLMGVINTRQMLIGGPEALPLDGWQEKLEKEGTEADLQGFVDEMIGLNLSHSVFIDCTASQLVSSMYQRVLDASISIVTANKLACAGDYENYKKIQDTARKKGASFFYETNVGAGLPVINTLNDLVKSGDKVEKIEAILSGSLNFIFNTFNEERSFSEAVMMAQDKGFTEPDPRIDLSGKDVSNKILILARELGYTFSSEDIKIKPFLPAEILEGGSKEAFWEKLKAYDKEMEAFRSSKEAGEKKLRVFAKLENDQLSVSLDVFDKLHPFYTAKDSDNIILFTTYRYREQPLMIKGPGAGAEVTAAGVFADIIRVAN
jgi:aspartokinase/homoserine dehydrogenase 1